MARTMGELLPESYDAVFNADGLFACGEREGSEWPPVRIFVDVGSGYGSVVRAAVDSGRFDWGIGIEKYREPQAVCDAMLASLPPATRSRMHFVFADFADCDLPALIRHGAAAVVAERSRVADGGGPAGPPTPSPSPPPSPPATVVVYVNNLAFPPGVNGRHGRQLSSSAAELSDAGSSTTVVSAVPLAALEDGRPAASIAHLTLGMSFNPAHDARVYWATKQ